MKLSLGAAAGVLMLTALPSCEPTEPDTGLSVADQEALQFMFEEEKLARDVYLTLGELWTDAQQLQMIPNSEQTHMDAIADLMTIYEIPFEELDRGEFNNADLKALYDDLVAQGSASKLAAFTVGATVEDLDIVDLQEYMDATEEAALIAVYDNLQCGSRNHLRAFMTGITGQGGTYTPQFLTQEEFDAILAGEHEQCN